ncbi:hypothetical protein FB479_11665 [Brevibacillus sp. AG162]|uniref:hypothetical protein n=1 Tax=Brevibacillus sp. AG162 TaxID=2572910 RepID=UPI001153BDED|nr:hypothetical protein [Brevibacillus sp. AG162]TQK41964.1 hypothetical protein FB479_11665 [Brevibacillus sp. AG162]
MGVTIRKTNNIPKLKKVLGELGASEIQVGLFGEDSNVDKEDINLVTLARVHEFGMTIKPKRASALTIPISPKSKGKRVSDFPTAFKVKGKDIIAIPKGKSGIEPIFILVKEVTIPERSFLRSGFDENVDNIVRKIERLMKDVLEYGISPDMFLDMIGLEFAGLIQKKARNLKTPPKSKATLSVSPGKTNPLMDTGNMVGKIRHKVVK